MVLQAPGLRVYFGRDSFAKMIGIVMESWSIGGIIGPTLAGQRFGLLPRDDRRTARVPPLGFPAEDRGDRLGCRLCGLLSGL